MKKKPYYTITEAARILRVTRASIHEAIKGGRIRAEMGMVVQRTRAWRIDPKSLFAYQVSALHQAVGKKTI